MPTLAVLAQQQSVQQQQQYLNNLASGLRLVPVEDYSPGEGVADRSVKYVIENADGTPYVSGGKTGNPDLFVNEIMSGGRPGGTVPTGGEAALEHG